MHLGFIGSDELSSFMCHRDGRYLTLLMDVIWDSVLATHRLLAQALMWKMALG
jgi:hypothetical protein